MSRKIAFITCSLAVSFCLLLFSKPANKLALAGVEEGKKVYESKCLVCHGEIGDGQGEAAYLLYPKPRDFTQGWYKIRSTPSGSLPTDGDLLRVISNGMPGSAMPAWSGTLSETQLNDVVAYVKTLSEVFSARAPKAPVEVGKPPLITYAGNVVEKGRQIYEAKECWKCHGHTGKGDGPSADDLTDDWGVPVKVADFTRGIYKGGSSDRDIYLRFTTGMTGTPMPSFATELSDEERWALVRFVKSLTRGGVDRWIGDLKKKKTIVSKHLNGSIPLCPDDPTWNSAKPTAIPLRLLWQRSDRIQYVNVRSIHNRKNVGILLTWEDATNSTGIIRNEDFRDAAAVQFSLTSEEPFYGMGEKGGATNIWQWKADWEEDLVQFASMESQYSDMQVDVYPLSHETDVFLTGLGAGSLLSATDRGTSVEDLNAIGFGTLTAQPAHEQNVSGKGVWKNGVWKVVFKRSLWPDSAKDANITHGKPVPISLAIWDGGQGDRDGQKAVTQWHNLLLLHEE
ncbi:MAG: c-type cytochrome [Candidatus Brocadiales bacterium]